MSGSIACRLFRQGQSQQHTPVCDTTIRVGVSAEERLKSRSLVEPDSAAVVWMNEQAKNRDDVYTFSTKRSQASRGFINKIEKDLNGVSILDGDAIRLAFHVVPHAEGGNDGDSSGPVIPGWPPPVRPGQRAKSDHAFFIGHVQPCLASGVQVREHVICARTPKPIVELAFPWRVAAREPRERADVLWQKRDT